MLLQESSEAAAGAATGDIATLRLVCLVRAGDGYVIRAVGQPGGPSRPHRQVDIAFGDPADRGHAGELAAAVRRILQWCDDGTIVALREIGDRLALRAADGTQVPLPRCA